jgi:hypothetical protein
MLLQRRDLHKATRTTIEFTRQLFFPLVVLFVCSFVVNQYFEGLARDLNSSEQGPWIAQIGEFLASLIEQFALFMIGGYFLLRRTEALTWNVFFKRTLSPLTAESLRALTRILLWTLVFIVPGIVMFFRLTFVPYIVFVDPTYKSRPDAVARSLELTKPCWIRLTLLIVLINLFDGLFELAPNLLKIDDLFSRAFFDLAGFLFSLFEFILLYIIFENLRLASDAKGEA